MRKENLQAAREWRVGFWAHKFQGPEEHLLATYIKIHCIGHHLFLPHNPMKGLTSGHSGSCLQSQHFGRQRRADHEVKRLRLSWPTWWNPISTKNTKNFAGCGGVFLQSQLLGRLRQENHLNQGVGGCSEPRLRHCTPAWWQSETQSQKKKKEKKGLTMGELADGWNHTIVEMGLGII